MEFYPSQQKVLSEMKNKNEYALFLRQGKGKTLCALQDFADDPQVDTLLVLCCPAGLQTVWEDEVVKHNYNFPTFAWYGKTTEVVKRNLNHVLNQDEKVVIIFNIESLIGQAWKYLAKILSQRTRVNLTIDQSQSIKNYGAKRTKLAIRLSLHPSILRKRILEGASNDEGNHELFSQYFFLNKDILGMDNQYIYEQKFCNVKMEKQFIGRVNGRPQFRQHRKVSGGKNHKKLHELIAPYTTWDNDESDLPEVIYKKIPFQINKEEADAMKSVILKNATGIENEVLAHIKEHHDNINDESLMYGFVKCLTLHQIGCGLFSEKKSKTDLMMKLIDTEIPKDEKIVIFCCYKQEVLNILQRLRDAGIECADIYGDTSPEDRKNNYRSFQTKGSSLRVLVGTYQAMGVGYTLTQSHNVFFHSSPYSHRARVECERRLHRTTQEHSVVVHDLVACLDKASIDNEILNKLQKKSDFVHDSYQSFIKIKELLQK